MPKPRLEPKPPRDDASRREHQRAVKRSLIALPAFGLTLLAAQVQRGAEAGYENYQLPAGAAELAFTLKGALRLEMMNSQDERLRQYRRLFGSNTKARDLSAWRSRVYVAAYANGGQAVEAAARMWLPQAPAGQETFLAAVAGAPGPVALLQVQDVYLDPGRAQLFSDLLAEFLQGQSRLLAWIGQARITPTWQEALP